MDEHGWISVAQFAVAIANFASSIEEWQCDPSQTFIVRDPIHRAINDSQSRVGGEVDADDATTAWTGVDNTIWEDPDAVVIETDANGTDTWTFSIVYSPIWKVPVLYFTVVDSTTGVPCPRARILASLNIEDESACSYDEHPVTGIPSCFLHPCRTADRLQMLLHQDDDDEESSPMKNASLMLWSWWVLMAPVVGLPAVNPLTYQRVRSQLMLNVSDR